MLSSFRAAQLSAHSIPLLLVDDVEKRPAGQ
jgi:hypothetical protein